MKRFFTQFIQDSLVTYRNGFLWVVIALALFFVVVMLFVIPQNMKLTPKEVFYDGMEGQPLAQTFLESGMNPEQILDSEEAVRTEIDDNERAIGIIAEGSLQEPRITIIHQGNEGTENIRLLQASIEYGLREASGTEHPESVIVRSLNPIQEEVPFNLRMVPVFMVFEVVMLGFLIVAVLIFQEKQEGSIRAYRVSPGGTLAYIASKSTVNLVLALIYGGLMLLTCIGQPVDIFRLAVLLLLASLLMTLLGIALSVWFRSISEFFFVAIAVLVITSLPIASYFFPSFAPALITWLPSYPVIFGVREAIFGTGNTGYFLPLVQLLVIENIAVGTAAFFAVKMRLMKEA
ncbi:MAG: ABC transporter permease [Spirochaetia bacterium]